MTEPFSTTDHHWMTRALRLAEQGLTSTTPNPRVGCVLVRDGRIVGEGWHQRAGEAHAEIHALRQAGERARDATCYVTLEPCAHHGRTPPCAEALIRAGVQRVVTACLDPFPQVAGRGLQRLRQAGITVAHGLMRPQALALNAGFFSRILRQRPWVRLKLAASLDGRTAMASGESRWITGPAARQQVQHWRARACAILTGVDTVLQDDPGLDVRLPGTRRQPVRVVLDSNWRLPGRLRLFDSPGPVWQMGVGQPPERKLPLERIPVPEQDGRVDLRAALATLAQREINEVHCECGPILAGALMQAGLVDELLLYQAPVLLGSQARPLLDWPMSRMDQRQPLPPPAVSRVGDDLLQHFVLQPVAQWPQWENASCSPVS